MANQIGAAFRSFWHTMTSNDRHSTIDSPYRTGRHVPLNRQGMGVLTSVATASESRADITSPYPDENGRSSTAMLDTAYGGSGATVSLPASPGFGGRPYSPGLKSLGARASVQDGFEVHSPMGEIPMQSFQDGLPPPPPVAHSWERIDTWAEENYPELFDQLGEGCTTNDLNELEHQLDCSLPQDVRESLQVHDGQERGGLPTGIIFGSMLLDCEEMVQEWDNWRKVNQQYLLETSIVKPSVPVRALGGSSQASSSKADPGPASPTSTSWRQDLMAKQDCVPPHSIRKAYAHPAWIPLVRDWGGNNLAVDLAPGPKGTWGQVILFGRDYDTKYVIARSWAAFLALVADDLNSGKWFVEEDTNELKLREFKKSRVEPAYFDILRWRMDQKYGRRALNRRSQVSAGKQSPTGSGSPYMSPADTSSEARGRSLHRLSAGSSPLASPNRLGPPGYGKSSPLARVTEEATSTAALMDAPVVMMSKDKLVELDTPRPSGEENQKPGDSMVVTNGKTASVSSDVTDEASGNETAKATGKKPAISDETMKEIEI